MNVLLYSCALLLLLGAGLAWFSYRTARRIERFLPPTGRFVDVPGARLHVRESGSGPAVLLVHGLAGQSGHFDYGLAERLSARFRVVVVDRPGSGHSLRAPGSPADISTQAAALAALIRQLQLGRPLVVGHSLGGAIALALAQEHPDAVGALALVAPLTHTPETAPDAFKALTIASAPLRRLFAWTLATPGAIAGSKKVLATVFAPEPVPRDFAVRGGGLLGLRPTAFLAASDDMQAIALRMPAVEAGYGDLTLPTAVLYGRHDAILDWRRNGQALVDKVPGGAPRTGRWRSHAAHYPGRGDGRVHRAGCRRGVRGPGAALAPPFTSPSRAHRRAHAPAAPSGRPTRYHPVSRLPPPRPPLRAAGATARFFDWSLVW